MKTRQAAVLSLVLLILLAWQGSVSGAGKKDDGMVKSVIAVPPLALPQVKIDRVDVSNWPKVRILATVLDGRGAPVEGKGIVKLDVLDGTKKATTASKLNPALVSFEKGQPLHRRKDAKMGARGDVGIGLGAVVVVQGYASTIEPLMQQRIREAAEEAFKPLAKGDRANLIWYNDRVYQATGVRNLDSRLVDVESQEVRKKCGDARREARAGGPITLGPAPGKDTPAVAPGTDLCGLLADPSKPAEFAKNQAFAGAFPRLFNLGPPFWDISRYCGTPGGALDGFGTFAKDEYAKNKQEREDLLLKGAPTDFQISAVDAALNLLAKDGKTSEHLAVVLISDGRDGWAWDLSTCAEHPPAPCNILDPESIVNVGRIAKLSDAKQMVERHRLQSEMRRCIDKEQVLTRRVALMQKLFHDKAQQWIGVARAAGIRFYAVGLRRTGTVTNPYDLERLRLLAEKTGGTYREVGDGVPAVLAVKRTMAEVAGQVAVEFTHQEPGEVEDAGPSLALRLSVTLDSKLERSENPGTQFSSEPTLVPLPKQLSLWQQLKDVAWWLLVRIQELVGYEIYVIMGWVLAIGAMLLALLITWKLLKKVFAKSPKRV